MRPWWVQTIHVPVKTTNTAWHHGTVGSCRPLAGMTKDGTVFLVHNSVKIFLLWFRLLLLLSVPDLSVIIGEVETDRARQKMGSTYFPLTGGT